MAKYSFLDELGESPIFKSLYEKGEGWFLQAAVASSLMRGGHASRMAKISMKNPKNWIVSRVTGEQQLINSKKANKAFTSRLQNDKDFRDWFCENQKRNLLEWNLENPELSKKRVQLAIEGLQRWSDENPEKRKASIEKFRAAGAKARNEKESWKIGLKAAHEEYEIWKNTKEGIQWREESSRLLKNQRADYNSEFNINMKRAHKESEAKKVSELKNIKKATEKAHYAVICPICKLPGDAVIMARHHFIKCTFNESKELEVIKKINQTHVFRSRNEIAKIFIEYGFHKNYFKKYNIFERYFLKLYSDKKTSGFCVLNTFDFKSYFKNIESNELERKVSG